MNFVDLPSPNFNERTAPVDMLVLHYTGMETAEGALDKLRDATGDNRVSAHYVVDEDGTIYRLVPEEKRAWHAGSGSWRGNTDINSASIGIEIVNKGHDGGLPDFPPAQMQAVAELSADIVKRHRIPSWNVIAHSDIAPGRKQDPGEKFPWEQLAELGVGIMPAASSTPDTNLLGKIGGWVARIFGSGSHDLKYGDSGPAVLKMQQSLKAYGYDCPLCSTFGDDTRAVVVAFQRHFRRNNVNAVWDADCESRLNDLLKRVPSVSAPSARSVA